MLSRFCLYGFLKNQRYFEPFLMLILLDRGMSYTAIGWLTAIHALTTNLLEIPSGAIADLCGRRATLSLGLLAYILAFVVLASAGSFAMLAVGMALYGFGDAFRSGTHKAMVFTWLERQGRLEERTQVYGLTRSWSKLGSALSSLVAAAIVIVFGRYDVAFWSAIPFYVINLVNVITYPADLDEVPAMESRPALRQVWQHVRDIFSNRRFLPLILESMSWSGLYLSIKDYLQPVLQLMVIGALATATSTQPTEEVRVTALVTGGVYFVLFLLSAAASRYAHLIVDRVGSMQTASRALWIFYAGLIALIVGCALLKAPLPLACGFVLLHVLQNLWRPILVSRFDEASEPGQGATVLSIEGQSQRLATVLLAPLVGWGVDLFR